MKKFFRKNKKWLTIVAVVLVTATVVGIVAASTNMIAQIGNSNIGGLRERNDDNLIDVENYEHLDGDKVDGVKISVDEDGVITLDGEAKEDVVFSLDSFIVPVSEKDNTFKYYFTGCLDGSFDTYYFVVDEAAFNSVMYQLNSTTNIFRFGTLTDVTENEVTLELCIEKGTKLNNVKIYPGAFEDPDANFYA